MDEKPPRSATSVSSDKFIVRLPDGMRDRIAEEAKANNRTMNAEVIARLLETFAPRTRSAAVIELFLGAALMRFANAVLALSAPKPAAINQRDVTLAMARALGAADRQAVEAAVLAALGVQDSDQVREFVDVLTNAAVAYRASAGSASPVERVATPRTRRAYDKRKKP